MIITVEEKSVHLSLLGFDLRNNEFMDALLAIAGVELVPAIKQAGPLLWQTCSKT